MFVFQLRVLWRKVTIAVHNPREVFSSCCPSECHNRPWWPNFPISKSDRAMDSSYLQPVGCPLGRISRLLILRSRDSSSCQDRKRFLLYFQTPGKLDFLNDTAHYGWEYQVVVENLATHPHAIILSKNFILMAASRGLIVAYLITWSFFIFYGSVYMQDSSRWCTGCDFSIVYELKFCSRFIFFSFRNLTNSCQQFYLQIWSNVWINVGFYGLLKASGWINPRSKKHNHGPHASDSEWHDQGQRPN